MRKPRPREMPEREAAIIALIQTGHYTLQELGDYFGVSRERIRQIAARNGIAPISGLVNLDAAMALIRRDPSVTGFAGARLQHAAKRGNARALFLPLGIVPAMERLFRARKSANRRARKDRLIAWYRAFRAEHSRAPTSCEILSQLSGASVVGMFGHQGVSKLRREAGDVPDLKRGRRYGAPRGGVRRCALLLAQRPMGATAVQVAAAAPTSVNSAVQTLRGLEKRGLVARIAPGRFRATVP